MQSHFTAPSTLLAMNLAYRSLLSYKPSTICSTITETTRDCAGYTHHACHHHRLLMMATLYIARNIKEPIAMWGNLFAAMSNGSNFVQEV